MSGLKHVEAAQARNFLPHWRVETISLDSTDFHYIFWPEDLNVNAELQLHEI